MERELCSTNGPILKPLSSLLAESGQLRLILFGASLMVKRRPFALVVFIIISSTERSEDKFIARRRIKELPAGRKEDYKSKYWRQIFQQTHGLPNEWSGRLAHNKGAAVCGAQTN